MFKLVVFYLLFIPFYQGQLVDGVREIVNSPEEAFHKCLEADRWESMPNGSKFAKLYKVDLEKNTIVEVEIPKSIEVKRSL